VFISAKGKCPQCSSISLDSIFVSPLAAAPFHFYAFIYPVSNYSTILEFGVSYPRATPDILNTSNAVIDF